MRKKNPNLGGVPAERLEGGIPRNATSIDAGEIGYVQHVDVEMLERHAGDIGGRIFVAALPGTFVSPNRPLAWCWGMQETPDKDEISGAFTIGDDRSFDQDPRFGLCVLAEVGQRALSAAINDPGTAIDVIGRAVRVLSIWAEDGEEQEARFAHVYVPSIEIEDLFDDVLTPLSRDAGASVTIQIRLQKAYAALAQIGDRRYRDTALKHSGIALERARSALVVAEDFEMVRHAATFRGWGPDKASG